MTMAIAQAKMKMIKAIAQAKVRMKAIVGILVVLKIGLPALMRRPSQCQQRF